MNKHYILKRFIAFLKKNKIYDEYVNNAKGGGCYRLWGAQVQEYDFLKWLLLTLDRYPTHLIIDAFCWPDDKWETLHEQWVSELKKFYRKSHPFSCLLKRILAYFNER